MGRMPSMIRNTRISLAALSVAHLASLAPATAQSAQSQSSSSSTSDNGLTVSLPQGVTKDMLGKRTLEAIAVQVMLDRSRHSPGVIDGHMGGNTRRAIRYYRQANGLPKSDSIDPQLLRSLLKTQSGDIFRAYTITEEDVARRFADVPDDFAAMAKVDHLGYESPAEMLAERFHMDQDFLQALNPDADFGKAGTKLVIVSHGDGKLSADIARIEVRKADKSVAALDAGGKLVASYPATIGSDDFPSPSGKRQVTAIATEPVYYFSPDRQDWGPDKGLEIAAGPNNPIGGTWIDLGEDGYAIHGSADPQMVGKSSSHGCVRLTNWDAQELAETVKTDTPVVFL